MIHHATTVPLALIGGIYIDLDQTMVSGGARMADLIRMITPAAGRTIVDATGLSGDYAVSLRFQRLPRPPTAEPAPDAPPALFTALEEQLGLKLEATRAPVQILVVDHVERPSEN